MLAPRGASPLPGPAGHSMGDRGGWGHSPDRQDTFEGLSEQKGGGGCGPGVDGNGQREEELHTEPCWEKEGSTG